MKRRILFVCIENSNRSQMAEAFAKIHGGESFEVYSAGSSPSGRLNPRAIEFMREKNYDLSVHHSKSLREVPATDYDAIIMMGCGDACPSVNGRMHEDWGIPDPKSLSSEDFRATRDLIERKVQDLLRRLSG